jgi:hypothetical protein
MSSVEEQVDKIFNQRDYRVFKWVFCRYNCETGIEPITDYQLFLRSGLEGYMGSEQLMKDYVLDNVNNVYKIFMNRVLKCLVNRGLFREVTQKYGGEEIVA